VGSFSPDGFPCAALNNATTDETSRTSTGSSRGVTSLNDAPQPDSDSAAAK
jgi:hypothetical protein